MVRSDELHLCLQLKGRFLCTSSSSSSHMLRLWRSIGKHASHSARSVRTERWHDARYAVRCSLFVHPSHVGEWIAELLHRGVEYGRFLVVHVNGAAAVDVVRRDWRRCFHPVVVHERKISFVLSHELFVQAFLAQTNGGGIVRELLFLLVTLVWRRFVVVVVAAAVVELHALALLHSVRSTLNDRRRWVSR